MATKVYILETGQYEARGVRGVYSTPELAMAQFPDRIWKKDESLTLTNQWYSENDETDAEPSITEYTVDD